MRLEQLHQIEQARRYAEQDEYVVTRAHIRNLLAIIEGLIGAKMEAEYQELCQAQFEQQAYAEFHEQEARRLYLRRDAFED